MDRRRCNNCLQSLAILGAVLLTFATLILIPWWQKLSEYQEQIDRFATQIGRFESIQARKPMLEAELQAINEQLARNKLFLSADTPALAAADMQQRVKQAVARNGGQLVSTQNMTNPREDQLVEIVIRVRMNGDGTVLLKTLHELESQRPLLLVDNLTVRSNKRYSGRGRARKVEFHMDTHFDLIGFLPGSGA